MEPVLDMLDLAMVLVLDMLVLDMLVLDMVLVLAMDMALLPPLLPDTESPMLLIL